MTELALQDGRTLHVYDTAPGRDDLLAVYWHHGSPNIGAPPAPLLPLSEELGLRWVSHTRPGYAGSSRVEGRSIAAVAADVAAVADSLGLTQFATMGHSGGGSHALATAALLPDRVTAAVAVSAMAPIDAPGLDWYAGFGPGGEAELRAAAAGRARLEQYLATSDDEPSFTAADEEALAGDWSWFLDVVRPAVAAGMDGFVDDDLASTRPWGFHPGDVTAPCLLVHGGADAVVPSSHATWNAAQVGGAELWLRPDDGHISIMRSTPDALRWLVERAVSRGV